MKIENGKLVLDNMILDIEDAVLFSIQDMVDTILGTTDDCIALLRNDDALEDFRNASRDEYVTYVIEFIITAMKMIQEDEEKEVYLK